MAALSLEVVAAARLDALHVMVTAEAQPDAVEMHGGLAVHEHSWLCGWWSAQLALGVFRSLFVFACCMLPQGCPAVYMHTPQNLALNRSVAVEVMVEGIAAWQQCLGC